MAELGCDRTAYSLQGLKNLIDWQTERDSEHREESRLPTKAGHRRKGVAERATGPLPLPQPRDSHSPTQQEGRYLHQVYKPQQPLLGRKGGQKAKRKIHQINIGVGWAQQPPLPKCACAHKGKLNKSAPTPIPFLFTWKDSGRNEGGARKAPLLQSARLHSNCLLEGNQRTHCSAEMIRVLEKVIRTKSGPRGQPWDSPAAEAGIIFPMWQMGKLRLS